MNAELPENPSSIIARRERLSVLCALDRASLRLILKTPAPKPAAPTGSAGGGGVLRDVLAVSQFFPGAIGRWSRRLAHGGKILRALI